MKQLLTTLLVFFLTITDAAAQSGVYVGGHIRRERPNTITNLKDSGFQYVILFNVNVEEDGTLTTDGETICKDGEYVFAQTQPHYVDDVKELKTWPTGIERIEICIGGWGNESYFRIKDLIATQGTGQNSILYKNFKALKEAIPEIDAVNNDDEHCYDATSARQFHAMMFDLGYNTTLAPYTNKSFWSTLVSNLNRAKKGACDRIMIQCYDGGAGNNPSDWHIGTDIPLHAGLLYYSNDWNVENNMAQFQRWRDNSNVTGGFVWVYNSEEWDLHAWATGMNKVFGTKKSEAEGPVTLYLEENFGGEGITLKPGRYCIGELSHYGIQKASIHSLKVAEGYNFKFYTKHDCTGRETVVTEDQASLRASWRNSILSIIIEPKDNGVENIESTNQRQLVYDITGKCLGYELPSQPGIYIKNGKKIVISR